MNVFSEATKKENDSVYFIKEAKVTTSRNIEDPEYYIRIRSGKFIPDNKIIADLAIYIYMMFPTPIFLPFGYFVGKRQKLRIYISQLDKPTEGDTFCSKWRLLYSSIGLF